MLTLRGVFCFMALRYDTRDMEPQRPRSEREAVCLRDVRADIFSIGGAILSALCVLLTVFAIVVFSSADQTSVQRAIAVIFSVGAWLYLASTATERLALDDHSVVYSSFFGRTVRIPLTDLQEMLLVHQGFNLERGIETIEFRRSGREDHDRISLGPCWQRHKLEAFLHSVEEALNDTELLEEVR